LLRVGTIAADEATLLSKRLSGVAGVVDVVVIPEEGVAYLKVDEKLLDENAIEAALGSDARGAQLPTGV